MADAFPIGKVYTNGHEYDSQGYRDVMDKIQELDIPREYLQEGDSFSFGSDVLVEVYGPAEGATQQVAAGAQDANDCSIAMRLTYGDSSFWTSGDLYTTAEKRLAEDYGAALHTDIVKMDHHGKDTSNCKAFVEALSPRAAVGLFDSVASQTVSARYLASGARVPIIIASTEQSASPPAETAHMMSRPSCSGTSPPCPSRHQTGTRYFLEMTHHRRALCTLLF